jgi:hypothetical protein
VWLDVDHETPDHRHPREGSGVSSAPKMQDGDVSTATTVLASCAAGAPANCEDVTDPLGIVIVVVFAVAGLVLLTVAAVLGTDPRRRKRPRRRR